MFNNFNLAKTSRPFSPAGFIPPTSGDAYVNGYSIVSNIENVRESLGLCPQHDVLFDTMTVEEHLIFFAKVRMYMNAYYATKLASHIRRASWISSLFVFAG